MNNITKLLIKIEKAAYNKIIKNKLSNVEIKSKNDFVTNCDLETEQYIISQIKKQFPNCNIISEEFNFKNKDLSGECFLIDPIDGTNNFVFGNPIWGIQIAYIKDNIIQNSVIYLPELNEMYWAEKGNGAYCNGKRIKNICTKEKVIALDAVNKNMNKLLMDYPKLNLLNQYLGVRIMYSAAANFSFTAKNRFSGYVLICTTLWDILPGRFICEESGKFVETLHAKQNDITIVADSPELLKSLIKDFKQLIDNV